MKNKAWIWILVALLVVIGIFLVINLNDQTDENQAEKQTTDKKEQETEQGEQELTVYYDETLVKQEELESEFLAEYEKGDYTIESPFVIQDPYQIAPLTALVKFTTEEPSQISITVEGKDEHATMEHTYEDFNTEHAIPVLGLYPGTTNNVTLVATSEAGETIETTLSITTDPLPEDFLENEVTQANPEQMEDGLTFIIPSTMYAYGVDHNGDVRWYSSIFNKHVFKPLKNGNYLFVTQQEGQEQYNEILEMNLLGKVFHSYLIQLDGYEESNPVHHDIIEMPDNTLLITAHEPNSGYIEDLLIEMDRETGETVREFTFRDIFPAEIYEDYQGAQAEDGDWFHNNAIWYLEDEQALLVSSRHQDLAMKMSYPDGEIDWMIADHENWTEEMQEYLLKPIGDDFKFPGGPHAIMPLPDYDEDEATDDYLLFDNNIVITRGNEELNKKFSRLVQYRVNTEDRTIEEVWEYGTDRGYGMFSSIVGDADLHEETGNRMLTSGYIYGEGDNMKANIIEVTNDADAEVVFELVVSGYVVGSHRQPYRAERMPLYP